MTTTRPAAIPADDNLHVHETRQMLTLHFNNDALQSVMRKSDPFGLEFEYTRVMMAFMLFINQPEHILLVGLGGGSMSKFCYRHHPRSRVTTLEISPAVLALRAQFQVPANNDLFKVIETDAAVYLRGREALAEVILLDGYDGDGLPDVLCSESFYDDCHHALRPGGMLVVNLWRRDPCFRRNLARLHTRFDRRVVTVKCESGNEIALAFKGTTLPPFEQVWKTALQLQKRTGLNFPQFLEDMVFASRNDWFYTGV